MKTRFLYGLVFVILAVLSGLTGQAAVPLLGAQVWIEPGQTPAEIDGWFRQLEEEQMPVARIFVMWSYIETSPGYWDYALYDEVFRAADVPGK